jgi:hypothetical protein
MSEIILVVCKKAHLIKDDMQYETRAVFTSLDLGSGLAKFVRMSGPLCLSSISRSVSRIRTEDVRNNIASSYGDVACLHPERDLYMRLAFGVGVVFGIFAQPLVDDELVELDLATAYIVADGAEVLVDSLNDDLGGFTRKDLIQHVLRDGLRQRTILAALHVKTFDLSRGSQAIFDLDRGVLFLLEQKQPLEDTVEVDFEKLVTIIDSLFQLRRYF